MAPGVELGFAAAAEGPGGAWRLHSTYFPSKVGGRPAWLGEAGLPGPAALRCGQCQQPRAFLLQLYAPLPGRPDAFHRTLFVFACRSPACYRLAGPCGPFRVFRNQLPRRNDTYPEEPPPEEPPPGPGPAPPRRLGSGAALCRVCGCLGPRCCGRCRRAAYCGPEHQALDWRRGHRRSCGQHAAGDDSADAIPEHNEFLFPEYEILIEPEEPEFPTDSTDDEQGAEDTSKDAKEQGELGAAGTADEAFQSLDEETLEAMAKHETEEENIFQVFKKQVAAEPEQIIRYCRGGGGPLWVSGENRPEEKDIPNCVCGAKRIFEFQIMPQLLNHLQVDSLGESIDWGTLVVYTCADSCGGGSEYLEEFIWKQDYSMGSTL
ncbi:programmed cell death protein 2 isoform X1 [Onychostruthus taczanowskii]|uniref:programmed cell death protein 2 isoform X1 n=1 Tax=Onychostruthus taczanowskii TaxID=356909 RepID=UPI001B80724A|nr:programmed cell death protein 2 isoform X1 [Onychostruthus taczanowskii]